MFSEADYAAAAARYDVPVASVKTVVEVEASGDGFLADGRPKILFEAHYFRDRTDGRFDISHPTISAPYPTSRRFYVGGAREYDRLAAAKSLNETAALESASWGAGQVMGANWRDLGFASVQAFVEHVQTAAGQMDVMMRFCKRNGLLDEMRAFPAAAAFRAFAAGYNGAGAVDVYAPKLAAAFARHSGGPAVALRKGDRGDPVVALQRALGITPDGDFGPKTEAAVRLFQADQGLVTDGIAGAVTLRALRLAA
jgi:hypothetical protein